MQLKYLFSYHFFALLKPLHDLANYAPNFEKVGKLIASGLSVCSFVGS